MARTRYFLAAVVAAVGFGAVVPGRAAAPRPRLREGASTPIVTLTSTTAPSRTIEARMAKFILSLQANDRGAATLLLSRRVNAGYRRAFQDGKWLARQSTQDFALIYFLPAIRVRTLGISRTSAVVRVEPLTLYAPREMAIGFIDVPMYLESGHWRVHPAPVAVQKKRKPAARTAANKKPR
jgi:hypothetical protein